MSSRPPLPLDPIGSKRWTGSGAYTGAYNDYKPAPQPSPFPCKNDSKCTKEKPTCKEHGGLFVKLLNQESPSESKVYEIPFGHWECWGWYAERIEERLGIPVSQQRIIFAGAERLCSPGRQHSGLQRESTIHLVCKSKEEK